MKHWFVGLLTASIIINVLLLQKLVGQQHQISELKRSVIAPSPDTLPDLPETNTVNSEHSSDIQVTLSQSNQERTVTRPESNASQTDRWGYLQYLRGQNRYDELLYEVQLFLRDYPRSLEGIMLEAEAIYYTKPLNVAIIHYYGLRERDLPRDMMNEVEKFIELHSTRTIQRFSGDANWPLLSAFLEPLIQVDPTNRNYIMSLAKSYGMEQQFSLMEDTLAALPFDDNRAVRLRESIYDSDSPASAEQSAPEPATLPFEREGSQRGVLLNREDNKLMANARVENQSLQLLVDTGASVTALRLSMQGRIAKRGEYLGRFRLQTAGGAITSPMYRVEEFYLGANKLSNVAIMLLEDENLGGNDGLLGMNVLSKFDFVASQTSDDVFLVQK